MGAVDKFHGGHPSRDENASGANPSTPSGGTAAKTPRSSGRKRRKDSYVSPPAIRGDTIVGSGMMSHGSKMMFGVGAAPSSPAPGERGVERKDRKNKREQQRRREINDRFTLLSELLFGSQYSGRPRSAFVVNL